MSEVEGQDQPPAEIVPSKSEDKLEIEKEEKEDKQKAEDIVGEMFSEEKKEETKSEDTQKEEPSSDSTEKTEEKVEATSENKEEDKTETKDKKFNLPKIKAPKIIKEIRSRSKSREKKKDKSKDEGEADPENTDDTEGAAATSGDNPEGEEKKDDQNEEKKDLVKEAKTKMKDAMENINLPKMPKIHKPGFMKKKSKDGEKTEGQDENKDEEVKEGEQGEKPEDNEKELKTDEDKSEEKAEKSDDEKKETEKTEEKKSSIIDSIKSIKSQVFPKTKKGETTETDGEKPEEEKLLEEKPEEDKEEEKQETKEKAKGSSILKSIRNVASGVPALFKKESAKEADVEAGEKDELLEKKEGEPENKTDDLKMEEIKLEDDKKDDGDKKDDEKKDPEKGDVMEEKSQIDRLKKLPAEALRQVSNLDRQRQYGLLGIVVGLLLLILIIIIAACAPRGWQNHHKLVEGGKYIETETACGKVLGWVEGDDRFLFRAIPYSVSVERFTHSRLAQTLDECGDEVKEPSNETRICMRRLATGIVGEEDCLTLDIATSSVVYDYPQPVVAYIGGDDNKLAPSSELAYKQGVVFVNIQVRQGILGFLSHSALSETENPPTSGNYALGDLITALQWIKLNIRHFGGDPDQVTLFGHKQGASLATALTTVKDARKLYSRMWLSGGAGNLDTVSLEDAEAQFDSTVRKVCRDVTRDCLVDADASELLEAVDERTEPWSYDDLPSRGEPEMPNFIVRDTKMIGDSLDEMLRENPVTTPIVIGVTAQADANSANYKLYDWNNTDSVDSAIENSLGSFDVSLSSAAMKHYNVSCNWSKYISMVSDIRSVCPLNSLAENFTKLYSDSFVSFYVSEEDNPVDSNGSGHVADSTTDISAIFELFEGEKHGVNIHRKFYQFVKGYIQNLVPDVVVFDKSNSKFSDEKCKIWQNGTDSLVPKYGRKF